MNSPTITMEKEAALKKLEEYEEAAQANPRVCHDIDRGVMQGYRVLARGGRLVDVNEAVKAGGLNLAGQPKLAVARAQAQHVSFRGRVASESAYWWHPNSLWSSRHTSDAFRWMVPPGTFAANLNGERDFRAMVPLIPLPHRPRHDLRNYFILWEANWHPEPPRDPYLLRPITGSLMEIIAEWDLTPLEIAAVRNAMRPTPAT